MRNVYGSKNSSESVEYAQILQFTEDEIIWSKDTPVRRGPDVVQR